jgi:hypothetical protein
MQQVSSPIARESTAYGKSAESRGGRRPFPAILALRPKREQSCRTSGLPSESDAGAFPIFALWIQPPIAQTVTVWPGMAMG